MKNFSGFRFLVKIHVFVMISLFGLGSQNAKSQIVTDIDGNVYNTISIGTQTWLKENLKTTRYSNGDSIGSTASATLDISLQSTPKYQWAFNGIEGNVSTYGRLYTWYTVTDPRKVCPVGWHVPDNTDWTKLSSFLGGDNLAGGKLKEIGLTHWFSPNTGATNETGFTAIPGGYRDMSPFYHMGYMAFFWTTTQNSAEIAWGRNLVNNYGILSPDIYNKRFGLSIRCLQDSLVLALPTLSIQNIFGITSNSATIGTLIANDGGAPIVARGVCWSTNMNPTLADNFTTDGTGGGGFPSLLSGLAGGTTYYVRSYATNSVGTAYSTESSFTTTAQASLTIGQPYEGGVIAYILQLGDPGYMAGETKGLVTASFDQSSGAVWGCNLTAVSGAAGTAIGTGFQNTLDIIAGCAEAGIAAKLCRDLTLGGFTDWYLPSKDELNQLYLNKLMIGGFTGGFYYSSSQVNNMVAWDQEFTLGGQNSTNGKTNAFNVRAVRMFTVAAAASLPTVSTQAILDITPTSATVGSLVTSDGGSALTGRGVCWSQLPSPTLSDSYSFLGTGMGGFPSYLSGLTPGTVYYVRAYATNNVGTAYGNEINFTTGTVAETINDFDGNIYNTVKIGNQLWMKENLKTTKYNDGSPIPEIKDDASWMALLTPGYCWYNNDSASNKSIYGALYNWYTVNTGKICPTSWHVPSNAEWTVLTNFVGGESIAGGKLKEAGLGHWSYPNTSATNEKGFTALPGGCRDSSPFSSIGYFGYFWSSTESGIGYAWKRIMDYSVENVLSTVSDNQKGYSVRCLKDTATIGVIPTLTTLNIIGVTSTSATISSSILSFGGSPILARGVCWSMATNPTIADNKTNDGVGMGNYTSTISGLTQGNTYYVRAYATNSVGTSYGNEISFVAKGSCDAQFDFISADTIRFIDLSLGSPTAWSWDFGDGTYSNAQNPVHKYLKNGEYIVKLNIINKLSNCVSGISKKVLAGNVACQADFDVLINSVSGVATFINKSLSATSYYWDFGDGIFGTEAYPAHTYTKAGIYKVCLSVSNSTGSCQSSVCKDVIFIPSGQNYIKADFSFFTDPVDNTIIFNDLSTSNTTHWYWTMGDGKVMNVQNPVYAYSKPGIYKVCLTAFDSTNSLSQSICKEVRIGEVVCGTGTTFTSFINPVSLEVSFVSTVSNAADNYYWIFGDGNSSTKVNPINKYALPGFYKVLLVVRNSKNNCVDKFSQYIQVGSLECRAGFAFRVNPNNSLVSFNDDSKGIVDYYYWDFGDGNFSVDKNPSNTYKKAGIYKVSQTVIGQALGCVDNTIQTIQVGEVSCAADFMTYIDSTNLTAYFTNRVMGESTALLWSFGDGQYSTLQNPVHKFPSEGIYSAGLNTYDMVNGCMDYYQETLLISGLGIDCSADFIFLVDPLTSDVTFKNKSIGDIVESAWNFGDLTDNSSFTDPVHTFAKAGYYNVCLTVTNSSGIRNMGCKWVLIQGSPANDCRAGFMYSIDSANMEVKFFDKSYGDLDTYSWDFGDKSTSSVSTLQNPLHNYDQKGYYLVHLKASSTITGCVSDEYKLLNISEDQKLKASFGFEAKDPGKKFTGYPVDLVSASSGDGATVEWDFGDKNLKKGTIFNVMDSTSSIVTHYYKLPGTYNVCIRISDPVTGKSDTYCDVVATKNAVDINTLEESGLKLDIYPNPFINSTTIRYILGKQESVEMAVYDQLGRRIETLVNARQESGEYKLDWNTQSLPTGVYHLKLITSAENITKQLIITR